jgi:hypothetical protein
MTSMTRPMRPLGSLTGCSSALNRPSTSIGVRRRPRGPRGQLSVGMANASPSGVTTFDDEKKSMIFGALVQTNAAGPPRWPLLA